MINNSDWNFVENKGQIAETESEGERGGKHGSHPEIKYYGHQGGVYLYCQPGKISFVFTKVEKENGENVSEATGTIELGVGVQNPEPLRGKQRSSLSTLRSSISTCNADLILLNSNPSAQILASDQQEYYENYYTTGNADSGITNVHTYKTITYKNIYPHIDMILQAREEGMKYEFMVHSGGKVSDIKIQWEGLQNMQLTENGGISYALENGKMEESQPISFQDGKEIKSDFINSDNLIGFKLSKYDKSKDILIDPTLIWGTYYGGSGEELGNAVSTDTSNNVYITGSTTSSSGIAFNKVYQKSYAGISTNGIYGEGDAYLAKFDSHGRILWATYFGGSESETGNAVAADKSGHVYISGSTFSKSGIATTGAYQTSLISTSDGYLAEFTSSGSLQWATYFGGSAAGDIATGVATDGSGNAFIIGTTYNSTIATSGAHQTVFGGNSDAFLAKFNSGGQIQWSTYFGGYNVDIGFGVAIDVSGNAYITGYTLSSSGIATSGAYQSAISGSSDAYIAKFKGDGSLVWATYFGGAADDQSNAIALDQSGNICITGRTTSNSGIATTGAYDSTYKGSSPGEGFLAKFTNKGSLSWSSYYGGYFSVGTCITTDPTNDIYFGGSTYGSSAAFLSEFSKNGSLEYATYYGGIPNGIAADGLGNVLLTGNTQSSSGIATDGSYQSSYAGNSDAFIAKFGVKPKYDAGVYATLNPRGLFCSDSENVSVKIKNYGSGEIDSISIGWKANGVFQKTAKWQGKLLPDSTTEVQLGRIYFGSGLDTIYSWTSKPNGQVDSSTWNDTNIETLNILPGTSVHIGTGKSICEYDSTTINSYLANGDTCLWTSNPAGFNSGFANPIVRPLQTTTYYLTEISKSTSCQKTDSLIVKVHPVPPGIASSDTVICSNASITLDSKPVNNAIYIWSSNPTGFGSANASFSIRPNQSETIDLIEIDTIYGCSSKDSIYIKVDQSPTINAGANRTICIGNSIALIASPDTLKNYSWISFRTGFSSFSSSTSDKPDSTTTYYLTATNSIGCSTSDSVRVTVNPLPVADAGGSQTICVGSKIAIGALTKPGIKYVWNSAPAGFNSYSSSAIVDPNSTTTYYLQSTNVFGCSARDSATITVNPIPYVYAGSSSSICVGEWAPVGRGGITGLFYNWSSSPPGFSSTASYNDVSPKITTTYKLTETNIYGCNNDDSVTITVNPLPAANVGVDGRICEGSETEIGAPKDSGSTYIWTSNPYGFTSTLAEPTVMPDVTTKYSLTEKSDSGCFNTNSILVTVVPSPVPDVGSNQTICEGTLANIGGPPVSGNSYSWVSFPMGFSSAAADTIVQPDTTTSYILFESGPTGCTRRAYITITVNPLPNARWYTKNICDTVSFFPIDSTNKQYLWNFGDGDSNLIDFAPVNIYKSMGYYKVKLLAINSFGCASQFDSLININCVDPQYQDSAFQLAFYPNPFHESATLHYLLNSTTHLTIGLYDAIGRQVAVIENRTLDKGGYTTEINSKNLNLGHGAYFLIFKSDDGSETLKIVAL